MSGFIFDAKAARVAIVARRAGSDKAAVCAVLAVDERATGQKPQQPQRPQGERLRRGGSTLARQPQEPQEPQQVATALDEIAVAIEERAALAADRVPACYLDAWARLQCQRPLLLAEGDWRRAIDDAGRFLDAWGDEAAAIQWTPDELFNFARGLVWRLAGERVETLGADHARLGDGRIVERIDR